MVHTPTTNAPRTRYVEAGCTTCAKQRSKGDDVRAILLYVDEVGAGKPDSFVVCVGGKATTCAPLHVCAQVCHGIHYCIHA